MYARIQIAPMLPEAAIEPSAVQHQTRSREVDGFAAVNARLAGMFPVTERRLPVVAGRP